MVPKVRRTTIIYFAIDRTGKYTNIYWLVVISPSQVRRSFAVLSLFIWESCAGLIAATPSHQSLAPPCTAGAARPGPNTSIHSATFALDTCSVFHGIIKIICL